MPSTRWRSRPTSGGRSSLRTAPRRSPRKSTPNTKRAHTQRILVLMRGLFVFPCPQPQPTQPHPTPPPTPTPSLLTHSLQSIVSQTAIITYLSKHAAHLGPIVHLPIDQVRGSACVMAAARDTRTVPLHAPPPQRSHAFPVGDGGLGGRQGQGGLHLGRRLAQPRLPINVHPGATTVVVALTPTALC